MKYDVIKTIKLACDGITDPKMEQDYVQLPESDLADKLMRAAIGAGNLAELEELCADAGCERENQGFVNGFRLGMRLITECAAATPQSAPAPHARVEGGAPARDAHDMIKDAKSRAEDVQALFGSVSAVMEATDAYIRHNIRTGPWKGWMQEHMDYHADNLQNLLAAATHLLYDMEDGQHALVDLLYERRGEV